VPKVQTVWFASGSLSNHPMATGQRCDKAAPISPVSAGGIGGLPRLRRSSWRREVGKTVDLPLVDRLGPSFSRLECPGGNGEAGVPLSLWNKSLRPRPRFRRCFSPVPMRG
jgi:hypothetical protein